MAELTQAKITPVNFFTKYSAIWQGAILLILLYLTSYYGYLLFHSLVEILTVIIAISIFVITWNSRRYLDNNYFIILGIAFLFIGVLDLIHAFAFKGVGIFPGYDADLATQLWLAARYLGGVSFLIAPFFIGKKINTSLVFLAYLSTFALLLLAIFYWHIFPRSFIEGQGLTPFKIYSEYLISLFFLVSLITLYYKRKLFDDKVLLLLMWSLVLRIIMELIFTTYRNVDDFFNLFGHLAKTGAFYLNYLGIIELALKKPYRLIFKKLKDSEVALRKSQRFNQRVINATPNVLYIYDLFKKQYTYVNREITAVLGYTPEDIKQADSLILEDLLHPNDAELIRFHYQKLLRAKDGEVFEIEYRMRNINNDWRWLFSHDTVFSRTDDGAVSQIIGTAEDITERKRIEEKLKTYARQLEHDKAEDEALLSSIGDGIVAVDVAGKVLFVNKAFEELTGHDTADFKGQPLTEILSPVDQNNNPIPTERRPIAIALATGQKFTAGLTGSSSFYLIRKDQIKVPLAITATPIIFNSQTIGVIAVLRDITREKEIDRAKSEFVSLASHQLRTPLTSISLSSELLLRGIAGPVEEQQKHYLEEIYESTKRMADLINALLNISRIELGTFVVKAEPVDLVEQIDSILGELALQAKSKKLNLNKNYNIELPYVQFDKNILRIIVENIVTNAIRYTPGGGQIDVKLEQNGADIILSVKDTGCGIPTAAHAKIFTKHFRADNAKTVSADGAGLGLYIVKSVAEKVGAKIWFNTEEKKGTTFFVAMPIK